MARGAMSDAKVVAMVKDKFVPVLIDFDSEKDWMKKHNVTSIPALIWADGDGNLVEQSIEQDTPDDLVFAMEETLAGLAEEAEGGDGEMDEDM